MDWYMGTIKRHPEGSLLDGQRLSLDYQVWLCRYDTIVILENGGIQVIEGMTEPYESRELLLPDPPVVAEGFLSPTCFWAGARARSMKDK
ncbi:hypothetical protein N6H14_00185 [Paenibacillus sp. CC-CFT747]|nr:hypothetical protein N6H14_00185 [Paenibacillus sp. CC-CFT747]